MMFPLYFAPINTLGNSLYRHLLLQQGADFVFSELLLAKKITHTYYRRKLILPLADISKTIFQIGAGSKAEVSAAVNFLTERIRGIVEINLNMGCPQSTMQNNKVCGGLLLDEVIMQDVAKMLVIECEKKGIIPSVKLRLGTSKEDICIRKYVFLLSEVGIKKIYIHLRPLRYNYTHPVLVEPVVGLQEDFPTVQIILNGDVDSYEAYEQLAHVGCQGVMIGRAALSNPFIFEQIKHKLLTTSGAYDPLRKDPELLINGQHSGMGAKKKKFVLEFLDGASELPLSVVKANLSWLTKGVSARGKFIETISTEKDIAAIIETFKEHFVSKTV
ncbi:tRNA-dihydrouridine synthase family protein [Candidatus Woesearchaeota archaeon]|nr:tRNA-dihydrouridine synthase family protein [Candidatus Woesearchaeota archaeon]